jgi:hypothetical protein
MSQTVKNTELQRRHDAIERTRGRLVPFSGGRSLVDELIAGRRAEARAEDQAEDQARRARARR